MVILAYAMYGSVMLALAIVAVGIVVDHVNTNRSK